MSRVLLPWCSIGDGKFLLTLGYKLIQETVGVLIATRDRSDDVRSALSTVFSQNRRPDEVIVLDDASEKPLAGVLHDFEFHGDVTWLRSESPSGVSGARNKLVTACSSDILFFLDDDAGFLNDDAIEHAIEIFRSNPDTGIQAFRIETPDLPGTDYQLPFKRGVAKRDGMLDSPREVSYYVGAAHAIRRRVFEHCGLYSEEFVYGHEELDLSYRAVDAGFGVRYEPYVKVTHHTRPSVVEDRGRRSGELYFSVRNRVWFAYRNLPIIYALVYVTVWSGYYLVVALKIRKPLTWFAALLAGFRGLSQQPRKPVGKKAVQYLKRNYGRLWM